MPNTCGAKAPVSLQCPAVNACAASPAAASSGNASAATAGDATSTSAGGKAAPPTSSVAATPATGTDFADSLRSAHCRPPLGNPLLSPDYTVRISLTVSAIALVACLL